MKKEITKIKSILVDALEKVDERGVCRGDYVVHNDILDKIEGIDESFCFVGANDKYAYTVLIKKVEL